MGCSICKSPIEAGEVECPTCGADYSLSEITPSPEQLGALELLRQSEQIEHLLEKTPSSSGWLFDLLLRLGYGLLLVSSGIFGLLLHKHIDLPLLVAIAFLAIMIVEGGICAQQVAAGLRRLFSSPLERLPSVAMGLVKSEAIPIAVPSHSLAILAPDGQKRWCWVPGRLVGIIRKGDTGAAYLRDGYLLDFKYVRVQSPTPAFSRRPSR